MSEAHIAKLEYFVRLSNADKAAILGLTERTRRLDRHEHLQHEGEFLQATYVLIEGWAYRYKQLVDGRRQVIGFLIPGDVCGSGVSPRGEADHSVASITALKFAELPDPQFEQVMDQYPRLKQAINWDNQVALAIQREWTVNLGQRDAFERMAHLMCELFVRLRTAGLVSGNSCQFPLTQTELGYATGLSAVHVNRVLQELRSAELIVLSERTLSVLDLPRLMRAAMFNANYLHLEREGSQWDAPEDGSR